VPEGAPGGMASYRNSLVMSFLFKACVATALHLRTGNPQAQHHAALAWAVEEESAVHEFERPPARGVQFHAEAEPDAIVGQPVKHRAADLQVLFLSVPHALAACANRAHCVRACLSCRPVEDAAPGACRAHADVARAAAGHGRGHLHRGLPGAPWHSARCARDVTGGAWPHRLRRRLTRHAGAGRARLLWRRGRAWLQPHRRCLPGRVCVCRRRGHLCWTADRDRRR